jgi:hypothetical protein
MINVRTELIYHEIARRLLLKQDESEICQAMQLPQKSLDHIQKRPDFRILVDQLRDKAYRGVDKTINESARSLTEKIAEVAVESFDRLQALLRTANSPTLIKDIAQDFLDRAGYAKTQPLNQTVVNIGTLEASVLTDALKREREARERLDGQDISRLARPIKETFDERRNNKGE